LKKKLAISALIAGILILPGCGTGIWDILGFGGGEGHPPAERMWTVMVYVAAANNMESVTKLNLNQMEKVGSRSSLSILVQLDTKNYCNRYLITRDNDEQTFTSPVITRMPHQNSGDPDVLSDFLRWGKENYPARHYALILWNHGSGWKPKSPSASLRAICFDDLSNDALDTDELREALESAGVKLDFLGLDACLMQMVEVATEVKDWAQIVCGSQEDEPWYGWPYDGLLAPLSQNPSMDAIQLGRAAVASYIDYYQGAGSAVTLSAISTSPLREFVQAVDALGAKLASLYPSPAIDSLLNTAQTFADDSYKDIFHFAQLVSQELPPAKAEADAVSSFKNQLVLANGQIYRANAQGLSIYLPTTAFSNYEQSYSALLFGQLAPNWLAFLRKLNGI